MSNVNERCQSTLTCTFRDKDGVLATPTTLKYRIDDILSGTVIKPNTSVSPSTSSYDITITASENSIINTSRIYEERKVSCEWYASTTLIGSADYIYRVINKHKIPLEYSPSASPSVSPSISPSPSV